MNSINEKIDKITDEQLLNIVKGAVEPKIAPIQGKKVRHIYANQILCFTAFTLMAFWKNGPRAAYLVFTAVIVSIFVDYICCKLTGKEYNYKDLSNISAGMCIALMTPAGISYAIIAFGSAFAIGIKHIFGGKDNYIFNPTAVALAFLIISYPEKMLFYPPIGEWLPVFGKWDSSLAVGLESVLTKLGRVEEMSLTDILIGNFPGPMGTTHIAVILVAGITLAARRSLSVLVTATSLSITLIIAILFPLYDNFANTLAYQIVGGYMLFGLLFLANDPQTLPKTQSGRLFYGIVLGALTVIFRHFGKVQGSSIFALLIANALSLRMDAIGEYFIRFTYAFPAFLKKYLSTFEIIRETAANAGEIELSDTREIELPSNYDMPPIDNKVTKINRKKPNLLKKTQEIIGDLAEKGEGTVRTTKQPLETETETPELEFKKVLKLTKQTIMHIIALIIERVTKSKDLTGCPGDKLSQKDGGLSLKGEEKASTPINNLPVTMQDKVNGETKNDDKGDEPLKFKEKNLPPKNNKKKKGKKGKNKQKDNSTNQSNDGQIEVVDFEEVAEFTKKLK